ncbi:MAG: hypothetical protein HY901_14955 [Deltaproteobacteria bacterium]|nr:hypothetical protein [Deltaproteobacteria bacterium]
MSTDEARIAYAVEAFKHPEQVNLLLRQLLGDGSADVYVHLDAKTAPSIAPRLIRHPRLRVLREHLDVRWGDISSVDCSLLLLREVLASGKPYDFVVLRSGQDLMVRRGFGQHLAGFRGKSLLSAGRIADDDRFSSFPNLRWPGFARELYDSPHPYRIARALLIRLWELGLRPLHNPDRLPRRFALYSGSAWLCLAMPHVEYVLGFLKDHPWFYRAFENALVPDEWFFQTLLMNSPVAGELIERVPVYLRWGTTARDRNHPVILSARDIPEIERSGEYFARKFDLGIDAAVVDHFVRKTALAERERGSPGLAEG